MEQNNLAYTAETNPILQLETPTVTIKDQETTPFYRGYGATKSTEEFLTSKATRGFIEGLGALGDLGDTIGIDNQLNDWAEKFIEESPFLRAGKAEATGQLGFWKRNIGGAIENLGMMAPGIIASMALTPVLPEAATLSLPVIGEIGLPEIVGTTVTSASFGGQQYQDTYKRALEKGLPEEEARAAAWKTGLTEFMGETVGNALLFRWLPFGKSLIAKDKSLSSTIKDVINGGYNFARGNLMQTIPTEAGTEIAQTELENFIEDRYGIQVDPEYLQAGIDAATQATLMSLLFGGGAVLSGKVKSRQLKNIITNPEKYNTTEFQNAINEIASGLRQVPIETEDGKVVEGPNDKLAALWYTTVNESIAKNEPININLTLADLGKAKALNDKVTVESNIQEDTAKNLPALVEEAGLTGDLQIINNIIAGKYPIKPTEDIQKIDISNIQLPFEEEVKKYFPAEILQEETNPEVQALNRLQPVVEKAKRNAEEANSLKAYPENGIITDEDIKKAQELTQDAVAPPITSVRKEMAKGNIAKAQEILNDYKTKLDQVKTVKASDQITRKELLKRRDGYVQLINELTDTYNKYGTLSEYELQALQQASEKVKQINDTLRKPGATEGEAVISSDLFTVPKTGDEKTDNLISRVVEGDEGVAQIGISEKAPEAEIAKEPVVTRKETLYNEPARDVEFAIKLQKVLSPEDTVGWKANEKISKVLNEKLKNKKVTKEEQEAQNFVSTMENELEWAGYSPEEVNDIMMRRFRNGTAIINQIKNDEASLADLGLSAVETDVNKFDGEKADTFVKSFIEKRAKDLAKENKIPLEEAHKVMMDRVIAGKGELPVAPVSAKAWENNQQVNKEKAKEIKTETPEKIKIETPKPSEIPEFSTQDINTILPNEKGIGNLHRKRILNLMKEFGIKKAEINYNNKTKMISFTAKEGKYEGMSTDFNKNTKIKKLKDKFKKQAEGFEKGKTPEETVKSIEERLKKIKKETEKPKTEETKKPKIETSKIKETKKPKIEETKKPKTKKKLIIKKIIKSKIEKTKEIEETKSEKVKIKKSPIPTNLEDSFFKAVKENNREEIDSIIQTITKIKNWINHPYEVFQPIYDLIATIEKSTVEKPNNILKTKIRTAFNETQNNIKIGIPEEEIIFKQAEPQEVKKARDIKSKVDTYLYYQTLKDAKPYNVIDAFTDKDIKELNKRIDKLYKKADNDPKVFNELAKYTQVIAEYNIAKNNLTNNEITDKEIEKTTHIKIPDDVDEIKNSINIQQRQLNSSTATEVKQWIRESLGNKLANSNRIIVVQSLSDLPATIRSKKDFNPLAAGIYYKQKIYYIADNIDNKTNIEGLIRHEGLHYLLRNDFKFEETYQKMFQQFWNNESKAARNARREAAAKNKGKPLAIIQEEAFAYYLQHLDVKKSSIWRKLVSAAKAYLSRFKIPMKFTDEDMANIILGRLDSRINKPREIASTPDGKYSYKTTVPSLIDAENLSSEYFNQVQEYQNSLLDEPLNSVAYFPDQVFNHILDKVSYNKELHKNLSKREKEFYMRDWMKLPTYLGEKFPSFKIAKEALENVGEITNKLFNYYEAILRNGLRGESLVGPISEFTENEIKAIEETLVKLDYLEQTTELRSEEVHEKVTMNELGSRAISEIHRISKKYNVNPEKIQTWYENYLKANSIAYSKLSAEIRKRYKGNRAVNKVMRQIGRLKYYYPRERQGNTEIIIKDIDGKILYRRHIDLMFDGRFKKIKIKDLFNKEALSNLGVIGDEAYKDAVSYAQSIGLDESNVEVRKISNQDVGKNYILTAQGKITAAQLVDKILETEGSDLTEKELQNLKARLTEELGNQFKLMSGLQHGVKRSKHFIPGYVGSSLLNEDSEFQGFETGEVLATTIRSLNRMARGTARIGMYAKLKQAYDLAREEGTLDKLDRYVSTGFIEKGNLDKAIHKTAEAAYFTQLAGNFSTAIINLTSLPINTFWYLSAHYANGSKLNIKQTNTALLSGIKDAFKLIKYVDIPGMPASVQSKLKLHNTEDLEEISKKTDIPVSELEVLKDFINTGAWRQNLTQTILGAYTGETENKFQNFKRFLGVPLNATESINRLSTFLATIRMENQLLKNEEYKNNILEGLKKEEDNKDKTDIELLIEHLIDVGEMIVQRTQGNYTKQGLPLFLQGSGELVKIGRLGYIFQTYVNTQLQMWIMMFGTGKNKTIAMKFLAGSLGTLAALGGVASLPFVEFFLSVLGKATGDDPDKYLEELISTPLMRGLPSIFGVDISGKLAVSTPFLNQYSRNIDKGLSRYILGEIIPMPLELVDQTARGITNLLHEDYGRAAENLLPFVFGALGRSIPQAVRLYEDGVTTMSGRRYQVEDKDYYFNVMESLIKASGFSPLTYSNFWRDQTIKRNKENYYGSIRKDIYKEVREEGRITPEIWKKIKEYNNILYTNEIDNEILKKYKITGSKIRKVLKNIRIKS